ncbi:hypothetical protein GCM10010964_35810 [Caldovatus sediminis]|uniref:Uncharacterized protein n=1 Tax=Caldovatus sediminis TaxID=2041189 RepID=A0A8J2ZDR5_9PROT|nr:hypothetical protein GCM10010964_35810 [Caldovatus sediminis]
MRRPAGAVAGACPRALDLRRGDGYPERSGRMPGPRLPVRAGRADRSGIAPGKDARGTSDA